MCILDSRDQVLRRKTVRLVRVLDSCHSRLSYNQQNLYTPKFLLLP